MKFFMMKVLLVQWLQYYQNRHSLHIEEPSVQAAEIWKRPMPRSDTNAHTMTTGEFVYAPRSSPGSDYGLHRYVKHGRLHNGRLTGLNRLDTTSFLLEYFAAIVRYSIATRHFCHMQFTTNKVSITFSSWGGGFTYGRTLALHLTSSRTALRSAKSAVNRLAAEILRRTT